MSGAPALVEGTIERDAGDVDEVARAEAVNAAARQIRHATGDELPPGAQIVDVGKLHRRHLERAAAMLEDAQRDVEQLVEQLADDDAAAVSDDARRVAVLG